MVRVTRPANPGGITPATGPAGAGVPGSRGPAGPVPPSPSRPSPSCPDPPRPSGLLAWGRESVPSSKSMNARARSWSMSPSSPAWRSCFAHAVTRWSAARTSAGGSSRPASPAFPLSSAHRSTRVRRAMCSRRFFAFSGLTSMTARLIAARSAPGVSDPARPSTIASAAPGLRRGPAGRWRRR